MIILRKEQFARAGSGMPVKFQVGTIAASSFAMNTADRRREGLRIVLHQTIVSELSIQFGFQQPDTSDGFWTPLKKDNWGIS
jgi:hypothetical protein